MAVLMPIRTSINRQQIAERHGYHYLAEATSQACRLTFFINHCIMKRRTHPCGGVVRMMGK